MNARLKQKLQKLANEYETLAFMDGDPSQFMHRFTDVKEQEIVAFVSANLSFGNRVQIIKHIQMILDDMQASGCKPTQWILSGRYKAFFNRGPRQFYRTFSREHMILFFDVLKGILENDGSLGECVRRRWLEQTDGGRNFVYLHQVIAGLFPAECRLIPHTLGGAAKRLNMFLRWMVRDGSPVDLGLWTWYKKSDLLMPLDTHVMQESVKLGCLSKTKSGRMPATSLAVCVELTNMMKKVFAGDPVKADYALFGLGIKDCDD